MADMLLVLLNAKVHWQLTLHWGLKLKSILLASNVKDELAIQTLLRP